MKDRFCPRTLPLLLLAPVMLWGAARVPAQGNIQITNGVGSQSFFYIMTVSGEAQPIETVELRDGASFTSWVQMSLVNGSWEFAGGAPLNAPLSLRLSSTSGAVLTSADVITTFSSASSFDFGSNFVPPVQAWDDLGHALAGTLGTPALVGGGDLSAGGAATLDLTGALPGAPAYLVMSLVQLDVPFKGGVLVPDPAAPQGLLFALTTDAGGSLALATTWPAGVPGGTLVLFQYWIADAGGPAGFAASNAQSGTTP